MEFASDPGETGLSQERLAFDAGIDRAYVGGLERQEENPTVDLLDRLAKTLSLSTFPNC
jgi:transcriptional regulator with XRE-family HTH domain